MISRILTYLTLISALLFAGLALAEPPNVSGFFYDPEHNGEGFVFEQLAPDHAAVYWFTYDNQGRQRWFVGTGNLDETGVTVDEWVTTHGPQFGDAYDPDAVVRKVAGNSRFTFKDCNAVSVDYTIDGATGHQDLVRLTHVADLPCATTRTHQSGLTGSWFDPGRDGEGMVLHVYDADRAVVVLFTYGAEGDQMWVLGTGSISGNKLVLDGPYSTSGGRFGDDYDPAGVDYQPWGEVTISLSCEQARLEYDPASDDLSAGTWTLGRLTLLENLNCDAGATWVPPTLTCGEASRSELTVERLNRSSPPTLVDNTEFQPDASCAPAAHALDGRLQFNEAPIVVDGPVENRQLEFPAVAVDLVTIGDHLVPVQPWLVRGHYSAYWEIVFSTGRVWSEPADGGLSRAVLPFTLSSFQWNEAHHGLLSFLFDENGVSSIHFQATQENLPWAENYNFRGMLSAQYLPGVADEGYAQERLWRIDMATRMPVEPITRLKELYGSNVLVDFNRGVPLDKISQAGIALDGVLYLQEAFTRTGPHPWPEQMRHGAFSVSKTAGAAVSLLRLAEKYGESVFDELIRDHVDVTADHDGWNTVTFGDTLSMTTGIGDNSPNTSPLDTYADEGDESNPNWFTFNYSTILKTRLNAAFGFGNHSWEPGEIVRYNSSQTMILALAMNNYVRSREGPETGLWELMNREVFQPIGIRWLPSMRLRITNTNFGTPPLGWGLLMNPHDMARIATLLQADGAFAGKQILHRGRTRSLLRKNGEKAWATSTGTQLQEGIWVPTAYRDATWSAPVRAGSGCTKIASRMDGLGGNFVMMMPNGITLFRIADANVYDSGALIQTAERIQSSCP